SSSSSNPGCNASRASAAYELWLKTVFLLKNISTPITTARNIHKRKGARNASTSHITPDTMPPAIRHAIMLSVSPKKNTRTATIIQMLYNIPENSISLDSTGSVMMEPMILMAR
ncbi:MAG: hypothetical protein IJ023_01555, partial [Bacteroidales bacterium]|nr:hypothetical protein [Bacteroidales bacterium]